LAVYNSQLDNVGEGSIELLLLLLLVRPANDVTLINELYSHAPRDVLMKINIGLSLGRLSFTRTLSICTNYRRRR